MANVKISDLTTAPTTLSGTETIPLVQSSTTYKVTAQKIANLATNTSNYGVTQILNVTGSPSTTYNLSTLFPTVTFTNRTISMDMRIVIGTGTGGATYGSLFYNLVRNNSSTPTFSYSSAYSNQSSGSPFPSFILGGTEAAPTIQFYVSAGQTYSVCLTVLTV
jgi:hypothetical protein